LLRLESQENVVKIMSYHMSKGLEFPVLFLPFINRLSHKSESKKFYSMEEGTYVWSLFPSAEEVEQKSQQEDSELVRLAYVAFTRARSKLYLFFSENGFLNRFFEVEKNIPEKREVEKKSLDYNSLKDTDFKRRCNCKHLLSQIDKKSKDHDSSLISYFDSELTKVLNLDDKRKELKDVPSRSLMESFVDSKLFFKPPRFSGTLVNWTWQRTSFSQALEEHDSSKLGLVGGEGFSHEEAIDYSDICQFPKGAHAGSCIHSIFEKIDFDWPKEKIYKVVQNTLEENGFETEWTDALTEMVESVISVKLTPEDFCLKDIEPQNMAKEMEFLWPFDDKTARALSNLEPECKEGVIKGFIDLTFFINGKFYILDYKSNWLGPTTDDYNQKALEQAMKEHDYELQAAIYLEALHRYLKLRLDSYNPSKNLGGAFYLFTRGIRKSKPTGIYFMDPKKLLNRFPEVMRTIGEDLNV